MRACAKVLVLSLVCSCVEKPELGQLDAAQWSEGTEFDAGDSAARSRPAYAGTAAPAAGRAAWANTPISSANGGAAAAMAGANGGVMRVGDAAVAAVDAAAATRPADAAVTWSADASTAKPPADAGAAPLVDAGANARDAGGLPTGRDAGGAGAEATASAGRAGSAPEPEPDPQDPPPLPAAGTGEPPAPPPEPPPRIAAPSRVGQLVITEIMVDPKTLSDTDGEWFELQNVTTSAFDLQGCDIDDGGKDLRPIAAATVVQSRAYVTIARREAPGFAPDYVASISFTNGADTLALRCGGVDIDRVTYDKANGFPLVAGASMALDPTKTRADTNDDASAWCAARESYGPELGTPGASNPACDSDDAGVDAP